MQCLILSRPRAVSATTESEVTTHLRLFEKTIKGTSGEADGFAARGYLLKSRLRPTAKADIYWFGPRWETIFMGKTNYV